MNDKLKAYRDGLTEEQKADHLAFIQEARKNKAAERLANEGNYKLSYMDSNYWQELAQKYNIRMPVYNEPCSPTWMRKYLNRCGIGHREWMDSCGFAKLTDFIEKNPKITLYGFVGNVLEYKNDYT